MKTRKIILFAAAALAVTGLTGCANNFQAQVARFHQALPPPQQGASFTVIPSDPSLEGSLEFAHYADLVAEQLTQLGYTRAATTGDAKLVVHFSYDVDKGTEKIVSSYVPRAPEPYFYPVVYAARDKDGNQVTDAVRYVSGYRDPFFWGYPYDRDIDSYTVYQSYLTLRIDDADGQRVFEGTARARSLSNKLTWLVPNLVHAVFTDFPGKNGEEIKVTVAPEPKK